jgi:hypothetical protein
MNGYITDTRLKRIINQPIALAQTELRRGSSLTIATISLGIGQYIEIRSLNLQIIKALTSGTLPVFDYNSDTNKSGYTAYGSCSVGLYLNKDTGCSLACVSAYNNDVYTLNPYRKYMFSGISTYNVVVRNNTVNMDFSVVVTGCIKIYN